MRISYLINESTVYIRGLVVLRVEKASSGMKKVYRPGVRVWETENK